MTWRHGGGVVQVCLHLHWTGAGLVVVMDGVENLLSRYHGLGLGLGLAHVRDDYSMAAVVVVVVAETLSRCSQYMFCRSPW